MISILNCCHILTISILTPFSLNQLFNLLYTYSFVIIFCAIVIITANLSWIKWFFIWDKNDDPKIRDYFQRIKGISQRASLKKKKKMENPHNSITKTRSF